MSRKNESIPHVTRPSLAAVLGVSLRTIANLEAAGVIQPAERGRGGRASRYDLQSCVPAYVRHMLTSTAEGPSIGEARRRVTLARAALLELQHQREAGTVIDLAVAEREAFESSRLIRDRLLILPSRLAPEFAAVGDAGAIFTRLDGELRAALHAAADAIEAS